ncbi:hypothetical protein [Frankia sp. AgW1.1]|uniref:hypothetical protein n=1 Tax=Frankia sp. AgW1.1 TaxID=1836971 RepID=UPI001931A754|nr:hypothetical protein [Frankia sp. AgW1.1]MBL7487120.1 hypothetical protein [Frankia sp. AgW1.1]
MNVDANAKVERWMLSRFRQSTPGGEGGAHLLRCPEATCGPVSGGEEDISAVTAGGLVDLEAEISCPHGERYWYRFYDQGSLDSILAELDDPDWREDRPLPELPNLLDLWCPTCHLSVDGRISSDDVMSAVNTHQHDVHVVVIRHGVEKDRQFVASGKRWTVVVR